MGRDDRKVGYRKKSFIVTLMIVEGSLTGHIRHANITEQCYHSLLLLANMHQQAHNECIKAAGFSPKYRNTEVTLGRKTTGHSEFSKFLSLRLNSHSYCKSPQFNEKISAKAFSTALMRGSNPSKLLGRTRSFCWRRIRKNTVREKNKSNILTLKYESFPESHFQLFYHLSFCISNSFLLASLNKISLLVEHFI